MTFPSKIPSGRPVWISAVLPEIGVVGLFATRRLRSAWAIGFGIAIVAGLAVFMTQIAWMRRHLAARPQRLQKIQFGLLHAANAAVSLIVAAALGLALLV